MPGGANAHAVPTAATAAAGPPRVLLSASGADVCVDDCTFSTHRGCSGTPQAAGANHEKQRSSCTRCCSLFACTGRELPSRRGAEKAGQVMEGRGCARAGAAAAAWLGASPHAGCGAGCAGAVPVGRCRAGADHGPGAAAALWRLQLQPVAAATAALPDAAPVEVDVEAAVLEGAEARLVDLSRGGAA